MMPARSQTDIETQFDVIESNWGNDPNFLVPGIDPTLDEHPAAGCQVHGIDLPAHSRFGVGDLAGRRQLLPAVADCAAHHVGRADGAGTRLV